MMKFSLRLVYLIVLLLCLVSCKESDQRFIIEQFSRGIECYENGDYEHAYKIFMPLAENGHRGSQNNIGVFYSKGYYVNKDFEKAFYWFHKSAENGNPNAMQNVADMYFRGEGVEESCPKALEFYIKGYHSGNIASAFTLGRLYRLGECVELDIEKSSYYFSEAAKSDSEYGLISKAYMYYYGIGVPKDYKKSLMIFNELDKFYDINEVSFYLAIIYYNGFGTEKDYEKSYSYYKIAYEHGSKESGYSIAYMAYKNQTEIDPVEAFNILLANAKGGHKRSQKLLSVFYEEGFGVDKDLEKAAYWEKQLKVQ